ncbi:Flp pilus assembly protein CpaB [Nevskia sp.]|uniref:Flp pilus assembly protein CpaB n=1 Tax=Nevskia sp. TaxID=1929292 RepID=UPI0025D7406C|nr:Flp pilus assembly protein CpaB [Nevskia sp.]
MNNSNAIRVIAIVLGLIAIVLVIIGWRMSRGFAESAAKAQASQQAAAAPTSPQIMVVVATHPLAANVPLKDSDVVVAPMTIAPTEYFANVNDAIGRTPLVDIDAGAPVVPRFFKDTNQIARGVPEGHRALSLKVDDVVGVGGFVRPGDIVDVLVYIKSVSDTPTGEEEVKEEEKKDIPTQARVLIREIKVLAYEDHLVEPPKGLEEQKDKNKNGQVQQRRERTAVLAIPEPQVTRVLLGAAYGELRLSLHGTPPEAATAGFAAADPSAPAVTTEATTISALSSDPAVPARPLTAAEKAKADAEAAAAALAAEQVITATELTKLVPKEKKKVPLRTGPARPPQIEIIRGSDLKSVSP